MLIKKMLESKIVLGIESKHTDCYGHLNNANYHHYFQLGRRDLQEINGFSEDYLISQNKGLLVSGGTIRIMNEISANQEAKIYSRFKSEFTDYRINLEQAMIFQKDEKNRMAALNLLEMYFIEKVGDEKRVVPMPDYFKESLSVGIEILSYKSVILNPKTLLVMNGGENVQINIKPEIILNPLWLKKINEK
jgi:acyl-CoA thioesterase FadM